MSKPNYETGVYMILNSKNRKFYIGSASRSFRGRFKSHRRHLDEGNHGNAHLQAAWNKYGKECFQFLVLERCHPALALKKEGIYIKKMEATNKSKGYNICSISNNRQGVIQRASTNSKISVAAKLQWKNKESRQRIVTSLIKASSLPSTKRNRSIGVKKSWEDPNRRIKSSIGLKLAFSKWSKQRKAKFSKDQSSRLKAYWKEHPRIYKTPKVSKISSALKLEIRRLYALKKFPRCRTYGADALAKKFDLTRYLVRQIIKEGKCQSAKIVPK